MFAETDLGSRTHIHRTTEHFIGFVARVCAVFNREFFAFRSCAGNQFRSNGIIAVYKIGNGKSTVFHNTRIHDGRIGFIRKRKFCAVQAEFASFVDINAVGAFRRPIGIDSNAHIFYNTAVIFGDKLRCRGANA